MVADNSHGFLAKYSVSTCVLKTSCVLLFWSWGKKVKRKKSWLKPSGEVIYKNLTGSKLNMNEWQYLIPVLQISENNTHNLNGLYILLMGPSSLYPTRSIPTALNLVLCNIPRQLCFGIMKMQLQILLH